MPDFTAQPSLRQGKLVQVLPQWKSVGAFAEAIYAICPYSHHVPLAVTAFVGKLSKIFFPAALICSLSPWPASTHAPGRS